MIGAIIGDVVGSRYEFLNFKSKDFELFNKVCCYTDDSLCSIAIAEALLNNKDILNDESKTEELHKEIVKSLIKYFKFDSEAGYGGRYYKWALGMNDYQPYNSFGNGSAMRVSSVGWLANSEEEVLRLAKITAEVTHNHSEGIKGAQAIAMCIYLARIGKSKEEIKEYIYDNFYPILDYLDYDELVSTYKFNETCQGSVPQAIYCFLISESFEDALKTAVSIGGDTDTIACMAGGIAEAYYNNEETKKTIEEFTKYKFIPNKWIDICKKIKENVRF